MPDINNNTMEKKRDPLAVDSKRLRELLPNYQLFKTMFGDAVTTFLAGFANGDLSRGDVHQRVSEELDVMLSKIETQRRENPQ